MSSRSLTWRRIGVGAVAVATVAAGSPLLLSSAASAAPATRITVTQDNGRTSAAAGTCTAFTATPQDDFGATATDAATFTVRIAESPESDTQDVDFCIVDGGTPYTGAPAYRNATTPEPLVPEPENANAPNQEYNAGASITNDSRVAPTPTGYPAASENEPDNADGTSLSEDPELLENPDNRNNPSGVDTAQFRVGGPFRFGVVGLVPGGATISVFRDDNNDREADTGEPVSQNRTLTITNGGVPGSAAAANAVRSIQLTPQESFAALASGVATHTFTATLRNSNGDVVGGVTPRIVATAGPNAETSTANATDDSCTQTSNEGDASTCTYTATEEGSDTVTVFVNQTASGATFGLDANEPRATATATTTLPAVDASQARTLVLSPESASLSAGSSRVFSASVTDINGAPAAGVLVTFLEDGPGSFQNGTAGAGTSSTRTEITDSVGRASVTFLTNSTASGTNTITATITTTGTQCGAAATSTSPAGQCTDTSPVTITAATASPSPSPSPTGTASPSPSPTATATSSPTATATSSPGTTEPGSRYRGLASPVRVLDTRLNSGSRRSGEIVLDLSGRIPDTNATTAVLNVTVTNGTRRGFLVAYPTGTTKPGTSNVNFEANQTQANEVVVRLSEDNRVSLFVDSAAAHVIADLVGSFTTSTGTGVGEVTTNAPVRAFDSRNTATPTRRNEVVVDLTGRIPNGSTDAVLNVTVTRTTARGFVTVFPTGTSRPGTSNVNFEANQTQANEVITRVGTGSNANKVSFFIDSASAALIVDVVGAVSSTTDGQTFTALSSPQRALDTRNNSGSRRNGNLNLVLPSSVPVNATGVILNVTATNGSRPGFVTVFPGGSTNPGTSNVNFPTSLTQANEVTTGLGPNNDVTLFVGGANTPAAHVIVDVVGYLTD